MTYSADDPIGPGDRAPDFVLPDPDGSQINLYTRVAGRLPLVVFYPDLPSFQDDAALLRDMSDDLTAMHICVFAIVNAPQDFQSPDLGEPFFALSDSGGKTAEGYGLQVDDTAVTLRFDPNLRLTGLRRGGASAVGHFLAQARQSKPEPEPRLVETVAPVLIVPHVLSPDFCAELINLHKEQETHRSTVTFARDGKDVQEVFPDHKSRHDHVVSDQDLSRRLDDAFARRVNVEIGKAFHFSVAAREPFNVVRYEAEEAGRFRVHRDNVTPTSAHMRFAVTVNLNPGEYDGGALRFPEYSNDLYAPPLGGAIVFSCSNLHEATLVTRGTRYALLTFLFGKEDAKQLHRTLAAKAR